MESQSSDFSIDHILNRAGEKYIKFNPINNFAQLKSLGHLLNNGGKLANSMNSSVNCYENVSSNSSGSSSGEESSDIYDQNYFPSSYQDSDRFLSNLNFDWLHYTRYRPPRIPKPVRVGPVKRTPGRLPRIPFTPHQLAELEEAYKVATYLSTEEANKLAKQLELTGIRVKIWFQNRRARDRRERKEISSTSTNPHSQPHDNEEEIVVS